MVKILAFDTETTNKSPVGNGTRMNFNERDAIERALLSKNASMEWKKWLVLWPYITQLAYVVYDTEKPKKAKLFNKYISLPEEVEISAESSKITHIYKTEEDATFKGADPENLHVIILNKVGFRNIVSIESALNEFIEDFEQCDIVVGHNVDFDRRMILAELLRLDKQEQFNRFLSCSNFVCTMNRTIDVCKIEMTSMYGRKYFKFPKLVEAYEKIFGYKPNADAMHDALIDVVVCLRVFCKLGEPIDIDICGTNDAITRLINTISSPEFKCPIIKKMRKPRRKSSKRKSKRT
jgi:DNA polymerase III epsilon subunit-like protein